MTQPTPTLEDRVASLETRVTKIETAAGGDPSTVPPPQDQTGLQPPTCLVTVNSDRTVKVGPWDIPAGATAVEVHEFEVDPANTLKATIAAPNNTRTSSVLAGGKNYTWALRATDGQGNYSQFSQKVTVYVPASGETTTPTTPSGGNSANAGKNPTDVIPELQKWKITLPTGSSGDPDEGFMTGRKIDNVFFVGPDGGVVFRCKANGVRTANTKYPRCEARQMAGPGSSTKAAWPSSTASPGHAIEAVIAWDSSHLSARRWISGMQIHDAEDDICEVQFRYGIGLGLEYNDGDFALIDKAFTDGQKAKLKLQAVANRVQLIYNDVKKVDLGISGTGWYFKAGAYVQSGGSSDYHEPSDAYGDVILYSLTATGSPTS